MNSDRTLQQQRELDDHPEASEGNNSLRTSPKTSILSNPIFEDEIEEYTGNSESDFAEDTTPHSCEESPVRGFMPIATCTKFLSSESEIVSSRSVTCQSSENNFASSSTLTSISLFNSPLRATPDVGVIKEAQESLAVDREVLAQSTSAPPSSGLQKNIRVLRKSNFAGELLQTFYFLVDTCPRSKWCSKTSLTWTLRKDQNAFRMNLDILYDKSECLESNMRESEFYLKKQGKHGLSVYIGKDYVEGSKE